MPKRREGTLQGNLQEYAMLSSDAKLLAMNGLSIKPPVLNVQMADQTRRDSEKADSQSHLHSGSVQAWSDRPDRQLASMPASQAGRQNRQSQTDRPEANQTPDISHQTKYKSSGPEDVGGRGC